MPEAIRALKRHRAVLPLIVLAAAAAILITLRPPFTEQAEAACNAPDGTMYEIELTIESDPAGDKKTIPDSFLSPDYLLVSRRYMPDTTEPWRESYSSLLLTATITPAAIGAGGHWELVQAPSSKGKFVGGDHNMAPVGLTATYEEPNGGLPPGEYTFRFVVCMSGLGCSSCGKISATVIDAEASMPEYVFANAGGDMPVLVNYAGVDHINDGGDVHVREPAGPPPNIMGQVSIWGKDLPGLRDSCVAFAFLPNRVNGEGLGLPKFSAGQSENGKHSSYHFLMPKGLYDIDDSLPNSEPDIFLGACRQQAIVKIMNDAGEEVTNEVICVSALYEGFKYHNSNVNVIDLGFPKPATQFADCAESLPDAYYCWDDASWSSNPTGHEVSGANLDESSSDFCKWELFLQDTDGTDTAAKTLWSANIQPFGRAASVAVSYGLQENVDIFDCGQINRKVVDQSVTQLHNMLRLTPVEEWQLGPDDLRATVVKRELVENEFLLGAVAWNTVGPACSVLSFAPNFCKFVPHLGLAVTLIDGATSAYKKIIENITYSDKGAHATFRLARFIRPWGNATSPPDTICRLSTTGLNGVMDFSAKELVTVGDLLGLTLDVNASVTLSVDVADNTDKLNLEVKLEKVKEMQYEWVY